MDAAQLASLTDALRNKKVVVVGDIVADEFVYGRVARVSREAPVLILEYDSTEIVPGGAGNAANNVAALGGRAILVAVVGRDVPGRRVVAALHRRVDSRYLLRVGRRPTPVKTRILAGGIHSAKQQVVRIDRGVAQPVDAGRPRSRSRRRRSKRCSAATRCSSPTTAPDSSRRRSCDKVRRTLRRARLPIPVLIDTRYRLLSYTGLTACTPNESEVEQALGIRIDDNLRTLERAGREILARTRMEAVLDHARQPRHGALHPQGPDRPHSHLRHRFNRRRDRRRRHRRVDGRRWRSPPAAASRGRRGWPTTPADSSS